MDPPAQSWQPLRKPNKSSQRTKTGCLTCRKRRIKCGEEKPVCRNCIKSKKECEGYTQQLKFRPPVGVDSAGSPTTAAGQAASRTERSSLSQQHEQLQRRDVRQARQERLAFNHRRQQRQQFEFHHESPASSSGTTNAASHNSSTNHSPPAKSDPSHSSVETAGSRLATYRPSPLASPLTDPGVSLIYRHFVLNASSMFLALERCVVDRETLVRGSSDPADRRGIFSHTVPLMALNNSALSQAILAFGCQHLAKGGYPIHSSFAFAHYHFALQRLPQSLNMPNNHIANIAISLLLALQDGLDCSHGMWSVNLSRIDQLFRTIDIPAQLRALKSLRLELAANPASNTPDIRAANRYAAIENEVDDSLLSEFVGRPVSFDSFCHLEQGSLSPSYNPQPMTAAQIDNLRILNDLYWMYLKFDTCMVSLVGKHPSGMEDCPLFPPRAAMNKPGALYGTLDHLLVICRRILAFGFCERQRKTKIADRNGGKWPFNPPARRDPVLISPPPESPDRSASVDMGMGMGVGVELGVGAGMGTGVNEGLNAGMKTPPHQLNRQEVIPEYFTYPNPPLMQSPPPEDVPSGADAYASSRAAEVEWHRIKGALALFHSYLVGPTFEPLAAPASSPLYSSTPFGPPIYYRDPMANSVMIFYHVSHLILDRLHPVLPPDPLSAIIHAAPAAMPHVNMLPRLFAGMPAPDSAPSTEAYIDAVVCSFYGGLQVTDPNSRRWLVELWAEFGYITRAGARETLIPGAERTWMALHRLKFGPAYVPVVYRPDQEKERERARRQESGRDSSSAGGHEYAVRGGGAWMYSSAFDSVYDGMCNEEDGGSSNSSSVDEDEYSISQISERFASLTMCIELEQKREEDLQTLWMQQAMQRNEKKAPEGGETVDAVNTGGAVGGRGWC